MLKTVHHYMQGGQPTSHWDVAATPFNCVDPSRHDSVMIEETVCTSGGQFLPSALGIDQSGACYPQTYAESPLQTSVIYDAWLNLSSNASI